MTCTGHIANGDLVASKLRALGRVALLAGLTAASVPIGTARANDSSASLDAGGLRLTFNPSIRVESEDLYLSRAQVRVHYRFHNVSTQDISTLVAFPLPVMEIGEGGNYVLQGKDPINIMDFQVTVDGQRVDPSVEVKATRFGVDVTQVLKRFGIPLTMRDGDDLNARLDNLPPDVRRELERYGVVDWTSTFGANNKPLANVHWNTQITYYWFQKFPAGRPIEVTHQYRPVPRQFFFGNDQASSAELQNAYCMDPGFVRGARSLVQQTKQSSLWGYELKYVLTTAGNWLGPIQKFRLTVDKGAADALVSLCADGLKRNGPTTFVQTRDNYGPSEDLKVLFVAPFDPEK